MMEWLHRHVLGLWLPYIGRRRIYLNRDLSFADFEGGDIINETGPYYVAPLVIEWLGFGRPVTKSHIYETSTGRIVTGEINPEGHAAGGY